MKANMGIFDRAIRMAVASVLAVLYYFGILSGEMGIVLMGLAAIFLLMSFISFCPIYLPFGLSTKKK